VWLWFTVMFANFAESMAEGRGKAQAENLRKTRTETQAKLVGKGGAIETVPAAQLRRGDVVMVEAGDVIPGDGEVIEGVAAVNEAAITGESAPVIRESGGDRSAVTGGTTVISDWIKVKITANPGETFLDRMIALVEGAQRQKTPNEIALSILLAGLTIVFMLVCVSLCPFALYGGTALTLPVLAALLVCLIPTTIGGLLSAIGIAGMDRLVQHNVLAMSGRAVEAAGDVDTLLLDKTGTITLGNRMAAEFIPVLKVSAEELADAAQLASLADETPEGRSITALAKREYNLRGREIAGKDEEFIAFSATTRMSGVNLNGRRIRKGATEQVVKFVEENGGKPPAELAGIVEGIARNGGTPLVVADGSHVLGVIHLKDVIKEGIKERFARLRAMGLKTVMITGDNPLTAAAIAYESGVDEFRAEATPETKLRLIREEQAQGKLVAMIGDGTNDAPALAQADVGIAMNAGTQAAREAGNMIDLDSNPTKIMEVVEIGKQLLITRGALTTFSIANDVAKYFAIVPAMFVAAYPELQALNIMHLATPESAILSAVIFNALIIIALIPLALRGVQYRPLGAAAILSRNLLIYGLGGVIVPFIGIKLIDLAVAALHLA
ncbi:MAG: potassium-transporting ATPase subunit KdpB, partial [Candidatus Binataceae bacterium]